MDKIIIIRISNFYRTSIYLYPFKTIMTKIMKIFVYLILKIEIFEESAARSARNAQVSEHAFLS